MGTVPIPSYNPSVLVLDVQAALGGKGIVVIVDSLNAATAVTAAADLLRALHVQPSNSPSSGGMA